MRLFVALTLSASLTSWASDPALPWHTLETDHFRIHFHEGPRQHQLAQRVARTCEAAHRRLVPLLGWAPTPKTDVLLTDDADSANGSASAFLRPVMTLQADVPDDLSVLNDYDDYLWELIVHEYAHVLHLDNATGLPDLFNRVFGKLWLPNAFTPRWVVEGLATFEESDLSPGGRNRSSLHEMYLRTSFLEGAPFRLDEVTHLPARWPRGHVAYLHGGRFLQYVAERVGRERLANYLHAYGSNPLPFAHNLTAQKELGVDFEQLFDDWTAQLRERYRRELDQLNATGATPFTRLTRSGEDTQAPRFSRDGSRIFYLERAERRPALRSMRPDGSDDREELPLDADAAFDLAPDDRRIAFSMGQVHREFSYFEDLYEADLASRRITRLTTGLRASSPAYSPDGRRLAFVARAGSGSTWLGELELASGNLRRLLDAGPDERIFTPAYSLDGQVLYFSQQQRGARHLRALERSTRSVTTVVAGHWLNLHPRPANDGRIYFASDQTGTYNLYSVEPSGASLRQLTTLATGAFHPTLSSDLGTVAFTVYGARGFDIARMSLRDAAPKPLPTRPPRPAPEYRDQPGDPYAVRDYSPWRSLVPQHWVPHYFEDPRGPSVGLGTSGSDLLGRHRYAANGAFGLISLEPSLSLGYSALLGYPTLDLVASSTIAQSPGFARGIYDRHWAAGAGISFPQSRTTEGSSLSLGYEVRRLVPQAPSTPPNGDTRLPSTPQGGTQATLTLALSFSSARRYARSVSAERGWSAGLTVRTAQRALGSEFTFSSVDGRLQAYQALPWFSAHHVVAARLAAGVATGDLGGRRIYALGGIGLRDPVLQVLRQERVGATNLRGFPPAAFSGNSYALLNLEYRLPPWDLDRGHGLLPLFLRRTYACGFLDLGAAGTFSGLGPRAFRPSLGVELRSELYLGYHLGTELRLGYARGIAPEGIHDLFLALGSTF